MSEQKIVTRNGVDWPLRNFVILKGPNIKKEYPAPEVAGAAKDEDWDKFVTWFGRSNILAVCQTAVKKAYQGLWLDNIDEATGEFNESKFLVEAASFTESGMKLSEIRERREETQAKLGDRIKTATAEDWASKVWQDETKEIGDYINSLKAMEDAKSRKKADVDAEPSVPVVA